MREKVENFFKKNSAFYVGLCQFRPYGMYLTLRYLLDRKFSLTYLCIVNKKQ